MSATLPLARLSALPGLQRQLRALLPPEVRAKPDAELCVDADVLERVPDGAPLAEVAHSLAMQLRRELPPCVSAAVALDTQVRARRAQDTTELPESRGDEPRAPDPFEVLRGVATRDLDHVRAAVLAVVLGQGASIHEVLAALIEARAALDGVPLLGWDAGVDGGDLERRILARWRDPVLASILFGMLAPARTGHAVPALREAFLAWFTPPLLLHARRTRHPGADLLARLCGEIVVESLHALRSAGQLRFALAELASCRPLELAFSVALRTQLAIDPEPRAPRWADEVARLEEIVRRAGLGAEVDVRALAARALATPPRSGR